jgi:hypothetical protein
MKDARLFRLFLNNIIFLFVNQYQANLLMNPKGLTL